MKQSTGINAPLEIHASRFGKYHTYITDATGRIVADVIPDRNYAQLFGASCELLEAAVLALELTKMVKELYNDPVFTKVHDQLLAAVKKAMGEV